MTIHFGTVDRGVVAERTVFCDERFCFESSTKNHVLVVAKADDAGFAAVEVNTRLPVTIANQRESVVVLEVRALKRCCDDETTRKSNTSPSTATS